VGGPVADETSDLIEPVGHPAIELIVLTEALTGPTHGLLQAAEGWPVPLDPVTAQVQTERAFRGGELPPKLIQ